MKRNYQSITAARAAVKKIEELTSGYRYVTKAIGKFNNRPTDVRLDHVFSIVTFQNHFLADCIERGESYVAPSLGTFAVKESSVLYRKNLNAIAEEKGYIDFYDVPVAERKELRKIVEKEQKEEQYAIKLKQVLERKNNANYIGDSKLAFRKFNTPKK